jgi:hypothetical protein
MSRCLHPRGAAATMIIFGATIVLVMFTIFSYVFGRAYSEKDRLRQRADAIVLAAGEAFRKYGPAQANGRICDVVRPMLEAGEGCPEIIEVEGPPHGFTIQWPPGGGIARRTIDVPTRLFDTPSVEVNAAADSFATESVIEQVEERRPKFVLVLDVSGSMGTNFGGGRSRCGAQQAAVAGLMSRGYRVDYGAVLFAQGVQGVIPIAPGNEQAIVNMLNGYGCPGSATNYAAGLGRALQLFQATVDTGRYTLFATDGAFNQGGDGRPQAQALWNNEATVFSLNIGAQGNFRDNLIALSGNSDNPGCRNYAFEAANTNELLDTFDDIVASIVCRSEVPADLQIRGTLDRPIGLVVAVRDKAAPFDERRVRVVTAAEFGGVAAAGCPNAVAGGPGVAGPKATLLTENGRRLIKLNAEACERVLSGQAEIVMRADRSKLVAE